MDTINFCYYPTTIIFADDHEGFLNSLPLKLDEDIAYRLFTQPQAAIEYIDQNNYANPLRSENCILPDSDETENAEYGVKLKVDIIKDKIQDKKRFYEPSVLIIDYDMPGMNGLEACQALQNPYVKKILLTGVADEHVAIDALNNNIIDYYIKKSPREDFVKLNKLIRQFQHEYFEKISSTVNANLKANYPFMNTSEFIDYFLLLSKQHAIVEYYFQHSFKAGPCGFVMVTNKGDVYHLFIHNDETIATHLEVAIDENAPEDLIILLGQGQSIPQFPTKDSFYNKDIQQWQQYCHPVKKIQGEGMSNYYCLFIDEPLMSDDEQKIDIFSFQGHLNQVA